jgi:hypothetical protein
MVMLSQPSNIKLPMWTKLSKLGIPKYLKLDCSLMEDDWYARAVLTILGYYRLYCLPADEGVINSIIDGPSTQYPLELLDDIEIFAENFFKARKIPIFEKSSSSPIYATTKAGAHGASSMGETSIADAKSVSDSLLLDQLLKVANLVYTDEQVEKFINIYKESLLQFKYTFKYRSFTARIHNICEGGGKTRAICIPDIWTQSVLKPVHNYLMDCLKRMPNDGTFSHSALAERVKAFTYHHGLVCYDLKDATTRMPKELQQRVLNPLLGKTLSEAVIKLMTDRDIRYKNKLIRYGTGQPMGMLSSWAIMTITHHVIINYAKKDKSFYAVIGDDMVLHKREAAKRYLEILKSFGA